MKKIHRWYDRPTIQYYASWTYPLVIPPKWLGRHRVQYILLMSVVLYCTVDAMFTFSHRFFVASLRLRARLLVGVYSDMHPISRGFDYLSFSTRDEPHSWVGGDQQDIQEERKDRVKRFGNQDSRLDKYNLRSLLQTIYRIYGWETKRPANKKAFRIWQPTLCLLGASVFG